MERVYHFSLWHRFKKKRYSTFTGTVNNSGHTCSTIYGYYKLVCLIKCQIACILKYNYSLFFAECFKESANPYLVTKKWVQGP